MDIKLNKKSWHAKVYQLVVDSEPPKSLCPYFWSLVAIIIFSPIIFLIMGTAWLTKVAEDTKVNLFPPKQKPERSWEDIRKEWDEERIRDKKRAATMDKIFEVFITVMKWVVLPLIAVGVLYIVYASGTKMGWGQFFTSILIAILIMLPILFLVWLIEKYSYKIGGFFGKVLSTINPFNWAVTKIVGGMIYATYKKACPIIEWEGEENKKETENVYN